jgi:hypothetical protein
MKCFVHLVQQLQAKAAHADDVDQSVSIGIDAS